MALEIKGFEVNMFGEITYLVWDDTSREAMIVDAGMCNSEERQELDDFIVGLDLKVKYLVNTHLHVDHVFGVPYVKERYKVGLSASKEDEFLAERVEQQSLMFGLPQKAQNVEIDNDLRPGDILTLGNYQITVIGMPGHSPGGIALYAPEGNFVLTGDSLFQGSVGRTDLPRGDHDELINSVKEGLLNLPDDTVVFPGHGPSTTIGKEKMSNPFL
ncbi:MAG: MBL fold metallo-hydrolase [Muribaculaceae bacterium]|nr:MBL fold metallo-hydrolase [Muribaculaceae bacterium]